MPASALEVRRGHAQPVSAARGPPWIIAATSADRKIAVTVPHNLCEDAAENRCDQVASATADAFVAALGDRVSMVAKGNRFRREVDLNRRGDAVHLPDLSGYRLVVDYHSAHTSESWYILDTPGQRALLAQNPPLRDAYDRVFGGRVRRGSDANFIAESAARAGVPCILAEVTSRDDVPAVAAKIAEFDAAIVNAAR